MHKCQKILHLYYLCKCGFGVEKSKVITRYVLDEPQKISPKSTDPEFLKLLHTQFY